MAEEVLRRLVERGDRDRQRQTDQEQSIKATEYIGNGYVRQIGQAPTRSRYLGNAGLVPGELVAPLGHGQQDVIIHKKPVGFTASQPQKRIVNPFPLTSSYTQTLNVPYPGHAQIVSVGVKSQGTIQFNSQILNLTYPGTDQSTELKFISAVPDRPDILDENFTKDLTVTVIVDDISGGKAGIGFLINYYAQLGFVYGLYPQTISIPYTGVVRIFNILVDSTGSITFNGVTTSFTYPGGSDIYSDVDPGNYELTASGNFLFDIEYVSEPFTLYNSWTDKPSSWYQYFDNNNGYQLVWKYAPGTSIPTPGNETFTYTQTITIPSSGQARIAATGVDDLGYITFNSQTLNLTYPGTGISSEYATIEAGEYPLFVSVSDTIAGGAGIGFRIEFVPDIIYISEE